MSEKAGGMRDDWRLRLQINQMNLPQEFSTLPCDIGDLNTLLADAQDFELECKYRLGEVEAHADTEVRVSLASNAAFAFERAKSSGEKNARPLKPTESQVEHAVTLREDVKDARRAYRAAILAKNRIKAVCEGLEAKRNMLMSLGAFQRSEMGDLTMRERAVKKGT